MHKKIDFHRSEDLDFMQEQIAAFGSSLFFKNAGKTRKHYLLLK